MIAVSGLYVITTATAGGSEELLWRAEAALTGGARVLQYRDKSDDHARRLREASALAVLCRRHRALFIVNDDVELAARAGAGGVHVGRDDRGVAEARARLGAQALIGASCYDSLAHAEAATAAGADYLAFGSFYPSTIKPGAPRPVPALLGQARRFGLPLIAIGGITADNAAPLIAAGADAVAVISSVFLADDPAAASARFQPLF
jgi:thiamine-phosphate pyrophosphorylase